MGIFNFLKKKKVDNTLTSQRQPELKKTIEESFKLPYFQQIEFNNLEKYYSTEVKLNNRNIKLELNFENKKIEKNKIEKIDFFLKNIHHFDKRNSTYIEKDFTNESSITVDYINFYINEFNETELSNIIDIRNSNISKDKQLLDRLKLTSVGIYPENETDYFAVFDYSIDIKGKTCNEILVVITDENGILDEINWEN